MYQCPVCGRVLASMEGATNEPDVGDGQFRWVDLLYYKRESKPHQQLCPTCQAKEAGGGIGGGSIEAEKGGVMIQVCMSCGRVATHAEGYINSGKSILWRWPAALPAGDHSVTDLICPACKAKHKQEADQKQADEAAKKQQTSRLDAVLEERREEAHGIASRLRDAANNIEAIVLDAEKACRDLARPKADGKAADE